MKSSHFKQETLALHTANTEDAAARQAALDIQRSFIVQAPAGSGKTTLLTDRVLALLAEGVATPEECLCITFTQKAAAEMRERVITALEEAQQILYSNQEDNAKTVSRAQRQTTMFLAHKVLERDALLGWELLNNPNRLRIQTIDALCAELAQCMPLQNKFGGTLKVAEDPLQFYEAAAQQVLESVESNEPWSEALQILLRHLDNDWEAALQLLAEMLSHRDQWLLSLGPAFFNKPERAQLETALQLAIQESLKQAVSLLPAECHESLLSLARFAANQLQGLNNGSKTYDSAILHCAECQTWPRDTLEDLPRWQGIAELVLTESQELRKTVTERQGFLSQQSTKDKNEKVFLKSMKEQMHTCLQTLQDYPDFCQALQYVRECPPPTYTDAQWQVVQALLTLLPILVAELMLIFQKNGQVDFIEIALAAHQALGDKTCPTDLALKQGYQTKHILVDEFQDTSLSQFYLLEKLTLTWSPYEGNTLFLVGDPMQSIYRFRRAEVSLFLQAKDSGVNDIILKPLTLSSNFRSHACIVDWVNQNFSKNFPKQDDIQTGAIRYTPFKSMQNISEILETPEILQHNSEVLITLVKSEQEEAESIVDHIKSIRHENPHDSMALLVRSRNHLKYILPELERSHIAYHGIELERLSHRPIIRELLSLSRALIHLGDKIAWLSLLSAEYCGIALADLEILATFQETLPLFWSVQNYRQISDLSNDAKDRLQILIPILEEALYLRERLPLALWIRKTWEKLQENPCHVNHKKWQDNVDISVNEDCEMFFKHLRNFARNEDVFNVGALEQSIHKLYATPLTKESQALQIMTIHRAKGLEFDTVFLAGLGRAASTDKSRLMLWEERRTETGHPYLLLAPIRSADNKKDPIYEYLRKQEQRRAYYENLRLQYVAATRAKKRLYGFVYKNLFEDRTDNHVRP